jgi:hypothetical protein
MSSDVIPGSPEDGERRGGDAPNPMLLAVVLDARFVTTKLLLRGNLFAQLLVSVLQRSRDGHSKFVIMLTK